MERTSDAKDHLRSSAIELIMIQGYNTVSVQAICDHADVKKGSFYYFFPSKLDLLLEVIEAREGYFRQLLERAMSMDLAPLERILYIFDLFYEDQKSLTETSGKVPGCTIGNLALELSTQEEVVRRKLQRTFEVWAAYFEQALQEAVLAKDLPEIDPAFTAQAILAYFEGVVLLAKTQNDPGLIKQFAKTALLLASGSAPYLSQEDC